MLHCSVIQSLITFSSLSWHQLAYSNQIYYMNTYHTGINTKVKFEFGPGPKIFDRVMLLELRKQ